MAIWFCNSLFSRSCLRAVRNVSSSAMDRVNRILAKNMHSQNRYSSVLKFEHYALFLPSSFKSPKRTMAAMTVMTAPIIARTSIVLSPC